MPLCARCSAPFVCTCVQPPKELGGVVEDCPTKPGAIWVHVVDDRGIDVPTVGTKKDGDGKPTEAGGTAVFDPVPPGPHRVELDALSTDLLKLYEQLTAPTLRAVTVAPGQIAYVPYQLARKPALSVRVVQKNNPAKLFGGATVTVTGPDSPKGPTIDGTGQIDFGRVPAGEYAIKVKLTAEDEKTFATTLDFTATAATVTLAPGEERVVIVEVEPINIVTPLVELEYKIVLLDNKLHAKQKAGETKIFASPTYIRATVSQTNTDHPFTKTGKLEFVPANVDVFTDEACTKKLDKDLTAEQLIGTPEQLIGNTPPRVWLRGTAEGKFTVKLTLADPADRFVKLDKNPSPEIEMGVVKLELKLHQQDIAKLKESAMQVDPDTDPESTYHTNLNAKKIPDQKVMGEDEKIGEPTKDDAAKPGRLLHVQDGAHFGRAQLIVAKINSAHLPDGTDDYDIVLKVGRGSAPDTEVLEPEDLQGGAKDVVNSGAITLYDAEFDGAKQDAPSFKISALKAADKTLWVEGTTETDQPCDLRLDAGMDRAEGGLPKTVKRNGDWTRYTVVKIAEVKLDYTPEAGKAAAWDAGKKEFYINLKTDASARKVKIATKLTKKLKNVVLHFMLAPDKDNKKAANWGKDMPAAWKWKDVTPDVKHLDKANRKDFLHLSEKTDADGKAVKELTLSRFGGDKFQPASYLEQDPHLAKYVEGHTDLEKKKPVFATDKIEVSRKFWHELIEVPGVNNPGVSGTVTKFETVKARLDAAPKVVVTPAPAGSVYPQYMIRLNGSTDNALVVSDVNKTTFFNTIVDAADKPLKVPILICDAQWDVGGDALANDTGWIPAAPTTDLTTSLLVLKPPLDGGSLLVAGSVECRVSDGASGWTAGPTVLLTDADVTINAARADLNDVTVNLPAAVGAFVGTNPSAEISIVGLKVKGALGPYLGESFEKKILAVYDPSTADGPGLFQFTICHELGHSFKQVPTDGVQPTGIPKHPSQYLSYSQGRCTGSHCRHATNICVMFESAPNPGSLERFCDDCVPYVLVTDMSSLV